MRHMLNPLDFSLEETESLLELAADIEKDRFRYAHVCDGKKLATLFYEPKKQKKNKWTNSAGQEELPDEIREIPWKKDIGESQKCK